MGQQDSSLSWRVSSRCDVNACVEVAFQDHGVAVRDNTQPAVHLTFDRDSWRAMLSELRSEGHH